jgi:non-ribosomal peptide synthetase component F
VFIIIAVIQGNSVFFLGHQAKRSRQAAAVDAKASGLYSAEHAEGWTNRTNITCIGIALEPSPEMVTVLMAVLKAVMAYVPLDPQAHGPEVTRHILDTARPAVLVVDNLEAKMESLSTGVVENGIRVLELEKLWASATSDEQLSDSIKEPHWDRYLKGTQSYQSKCNLL